MADVTGECWCQYMVPFDGVSCEKPAETLTTEPAPAAEPESKWNPACCDVDDPTYSLAGQLAGCILGETCNTVPKLVLMISIFSRDIVSNFVLTIITSEPLRL